MEKRSARIFAFIGAVITWFALIAQFYLHMKNSPVPSGEALLRFFGYFTIDTNILVAVSFTLIVLNSNSRLSKFFTKASTVTAITAYIIIVGITYNVFLRSEWNPEGLQKLVDELLHSVIPIVYVIFWVAFVPAEKLKWKFAFLWLIYPIIYMIYAIILGAITKHYPYPFVDVNDLGYNKAMINAGLVLLTMFLLSLALIGTGKIMKKFDGNEEKALS
jgi:hypothetical protein